MNKRKVFVWTIIIFMITAGIYNYFTKEDPEVCASLSMFPEKAVTDPITVWTHKIYGSDCEVLKQNCEAVGGAFKEKAGTDPMVCIIEVNNV